MTKAAISFRGFDEQADVRIYYNGSLPHWRQKHCTYFVTFRLADSIPEPVLRQHQYEQSLWLKKRGIDTRQTTWHTQLSCLPRDELRLYERFMARMINLSLDECHGDCLLRDQELAAKVSAALDHFHAKRVLTGDYVVMPNHVHALLTPLDDFELEEMLHSIKSYTANQINRAVNRTGRLWQSNSYDHLVRDPEQLQAFQEYIAQNPAKAKLKPTEYILSRAKYEFP